MKFLITITCILLFLVLAAIKVNAQTCPVMPSGLVCLTRDAAVAALEAGDKAKALEVENKELREKVIPALKDEIANMRLEYIKASTESTVLKQNAVSDRSIIEILLKFSKKKCMPFSVCF